MLANKLKKGDIIGVVSPSLPIITPFKKFYELGKKELRDMGFKVKESKNCRKVHWWSGGTVKQRADDINKMFADKEIKAIIVQNGGNSALSILEHLDYELIKKNPKPFIGFSDATNFHSAFFTKANQVGFHMGLLSYSLGWVWNEEKRNKKLLAKELFIKALTESKPLGMVKPITKWNCWKVGKANGMLFGGNLAMLESLVGTGYFPSLNKLKGAILFWEIDNVPLHRIERALYTLKYHGVLDIISGMVIGKLADLQPMPWKKIKEPSPKKLILEILKDYNFPILSEVDFGHKNINIPMFVGLKARMNAKKKTLEILESALN